ncbi:hypothetical protein P3W85_15360 [Cupriavidus basilensis]|uniref:Preprotein translocase subunit SecD n=1 Tax=Cupriavidus basilensis TaxID=68895 RepID=A0ABT6ANX3_9BURK|nr:hypothetical protein [Cupriavidus basilensis]MDF3834320.1 hypothetical protein [Cupriavidus basilensis]
MKPEALLPDGVDTVQANGLAVRKGSVGALLANWRVLSDARHDDASRAAAEADLLALLPGLAALGLFDVFAARDPRLAALIARQQAGKLES